MKSTFIIASFITCGLAAVLIAWLQPIGNFWFQVIYLWVITFAANLAFEKLKPWLVWALVRLKEKVKL
jgi:hypothetical protein